MNRGKAISGIIALAIYIGMVFLILFFYNIHKTKAKNYVEKNSDRVTVTLVNSDKTVFNRSDKVTLPKKVAPKVVPPVVLPKKVAHVRPKRAVKPIPKPRKVTPKKVVPKKPKKVIPKKVVPKKPKKVIPKKVVPKKVVPKKKVPKKSAKDLFSSVSTQRPVRTQPKRVARPPVIRQSSVRHNSSITDRIKATHQSGRVSNANRDKGVESRYRARVLQHMKNWNAEGHKGERVTIKLTVYQSGKFKYRIVSGVSGSMINSLKRHMDMLNRLGLGRHNSPTPHTFTVNFHIRG